MIERRVNHRKILVINLLIGHFHVELSKHSKLKDLSTKSLITSLLIENRCQTESSSSSRHFWPTSSVPRPFSASGCRWHSWSDDVSSPPSSVPVRLLATWTAAVVGCVCWPSRRPAGGRTLSQARKVRRGTWPGRRCRRALVVGTESLCLEETLRGPMMTRPL